MKTSELTGAALDWAVATANGDYPQWDSEWKVFYAANGDDMNYSTNWAQGGPIIEREKIATRYDHDEQEWQATFPDMDGWVYGWGTTPLIAAMRCYVASKLGDNIELPEELK